MELNPRLLDKIHTIEAIVSRDQGDMSLFALFLREDAPGRWDLVIAAPWIRDRRTEVMKYIAAVLSSHLLPEEMIIISRIVLLEALDPGVVRMNRLLDIHHERPIEVEGNTLFGVPIATGYVVTSQRLPA